MRFKQKNNPRSPWRRGPHCVGKRATLSFARYLKKGKTK